MFGRRGIGPVSLRKELYHRSDWLNLLLPYCPESLERLVDACPVCGPLGWRWTRGLRYDADDVDALQTLLRSSVSAEATAARFELPVYAIGQLVSLGMVDAHTDPGVLVLRGQNLKTASVTDLARTLDEAVIRGRPPEGSVSLRSAMIRYPGEKPWGRILLLIKAQRIPCYVEGVVPATARSMFVCAAKLPTLLLCLEERGEQILTLTHVSMRDAGEILGAGFNETVAALASHEIQRNSFGKRSGVSREAVQRLAEIIAFTGEAAVYTNRNAVGLYHELTRRGIARVHGARSRHALIDLGLVCAVPLADAGNPRDKIGELVPSG